jgi:glutathione S-transferase
VTTSATPILYSFRRCPYAMRARLAILASGLRCHLREVKLSAKPQAMLDVSPKGTVPVLLQADGGVIEESLGIMRWALTLNDPQAWLAREDRDLIATNDGPFKQLLDGYKYPERLGSDPAISRAGAMAFLHALEGRLSLERQLCGPMPGITDAAIMPFVRQFAAVDPAWFADQPLPHVRRWLDDHLASPLFAAIMVRVPPWSPGSSPIIFPEA